MIKIKILKAYSVTFLILLVCSISYSQAEIKYAKAYRNVVDFKNDKTLCETNFTYELKSDVNNSYTVKAKDIKISAKEMKYGIWMISDGDYLYFNSSRHGFNSAFIKFKRGSTYYYFYSKPVKSIAQKKRIENSFYEFGLTGLAVSSTIINSENKMFNHNVLNISKGTTDILSVKYIENLLVPYLDLLKEFNLIENKNDLEVLKMYLYKVNEKLNSKG